MESICDFSLDLTSTLARLHLSSPFFYSMKTFLFLIPALLAALPQLGAQDFTNLKFISIGRWIFDGNSLDGWEGNPDIWRIEDEAITASIPAGESLQKNEFLYWKGDVSDFELSLRYRITGGPTANSGIQIRSQKDASGHAVGYQCDLDDGKLWLGRIYDEHGRGLIGERGALTKISPVGERHVIPFSEPASLTRFAKADDWNHYLIRAQGNRIEVHINGVHFTTLVDYQRDQADLSGLLALQIHSGAGPAKIQFRDIVLTSLGKKKSALSERPNPSSGRLGSSPLLWNLNPNPAGKPDDITSNMFVPEGFQVETIAKEPLLRQPIAFTFDSRGRIWVAEAYAYPRRQREGQGKDPPRHTRRQGSRWHFRIPQSLC